MSTAAAIAINTRLITLNVLPPPLCTHRRLQAAGKPAERQIEPKKEITEKAIVAIKAQHPTLA